MTTFKERLIQFYKFPAAVIVFAFFTVLLIFRDKVLRMPLEPFAEHTRAILKQNITIFSGVIWLAFAVRLSFKFLLPLF